MISVQNLCETSRSRTLRTRWLMPRGVMARSLMSDLLGCPSGGDGRAARAPRQAPPSAARSAVGDESSADEVFVESEEAVEAEFLHDGETGTVDPSDPPLTIADTEVPRVAATLGRGFDHVAESSALNRLTQREGIVDGAARLEECYGFRHDPLRRHETQAISPQSPHQSPRPRVVLVTPVAQRDPGAGVDEDCPKGAHRRRRDRRGAP